jgi:hypothetical protein
MVIKKIISGAQTGADRAALDAALALGFPIGGRVPRGRRAEDGPVPDHYPNLRETDTDDYETRTRWNVQDADATLILSHGPLTGGSKFTEDIARSLGKPVRHVDLDATSIDDAVSEIRAWLATVEGETLNVAGPRASNDLEIYEKTREAIRHLLTVDSK